MLISRLHSVYALNGGMWVKRRCNLVNRKDSSHMFNTESPLAVELQVIPVNSKKLINFDMTSSNTGN